MNKSNVGKIYYIYKSIFKYTVFSILFLSFSRTAYSFHDWENIKPSYSFSKKIPLHLVILNNSTWNIEGVIKRIRKTEKIYSQCRLSFFPIKILTLKNQNFNSSFNFHEKEDIDIINELKIDHRPLIIFAHKNTAAISSDAYSWIDKHGVESTRKNVAFIFSHWKRTQRYLKIFDGITKYSVLAHELGHILLNSSTHEDIPNNIMGIKKAPMGDGFTEDQCKQFFL